MIFEGGLTGPVGVFLLGLSATAVVALLIASVQGPMTRFPVALNMVVGVAYLPIVLIAVNGLPSGIVDKTRTGLLVLLLGAIISGLIHYIIWQRYGSSRRPDGNTDDFTSAGPSVKTTFSSGDYHKLVVKAEQVAKDLCYIQFRVAPYFLSTEAIRHMAKLRFGEGNDDGDKYVEAQDARQKAFFRLMSSGARIREIYARDRLIQYVMTGTHQTNLWPLPPAMIIQLLNNWRRAVISNPNYFVAISDENVPFKYHVIDRHKVVIHEPIGRGDKNRLNALIIDDSRTAEMVAKDFEYVWSLVDTRWRDREHVGQWIEEFLIPLAVQSRSVARMRAPEGSESSVEEASGASND
jgi:hypothetical protein